MGIRSKKSRYPGRKSHPVVIAAAAFVVLVVSAAVASAADLEFVLLERCGHFLRFMIVLRIIATHNALQPRKLIDHIRHQIALVIKFHILAGPVCNRQNQIPKIRLAFPSRTRRATSGANALTRERQPAMSPILWG